MPLNIPRLLLFSLLLAVLLMIAACGPAAAGAINARLQGMSAGATGTAEIGVIITFTDRIDPKSFRHLPQKSRRDALVRGLRDTAAGSQSRLRPLLSVLGGRDIHSLWTINALSCRIRPELLDLIAAQPGVEEVRPDDTFSLPPFATQAATTSEWNIAAVGAPALWNLGLTGAGVVVASLDSGVDPAHADLAGKWRGGPHDWFDPYAQHAIPFDNNGHGTAVMGLMVGGDAGATAIGVAPGAGWIAAKIFDDSGSATYSAIHRAFAWVLDPDGDGDTGDAPQVVNNSWVLYPANGCQTDFQTDLGLLKEADIAVVFSAGNDGPNLSTSNSPANCPGNLAVGAANRTGRVSSFSSRGPSPCAGAQTFPSLVAPGEEIRCADLTSGGSQPFSYITLSGTSFAAPHVSGLLALLLGADASAGITVTDLEEALKKSADDLGSLGPDNNAGAGLVNGLAAYRRLAGLPHLALYDPAPPEFDRLLPFGKLTPGTSRSRSLTIRNSGGGDLLLGSLGGATLDPAFTVTADACSNTTLPSDQSCEVTVTFAPLAIATYKGALSLPSNDFDQNPLLINLTGSVLDNSLPPLPQYNPGNRILDFGSVAPGAAARLAMTITNGGGKLLTFSTINHAALAVPFAVAVDECSNHSLAGQETCRMEFSFSPKDLREYQGKLTITTNAGVAVLSLTGLGNHPPAAATPLSPGNGSVGLDPGHLTLSWQPGVDSDGDPVSEQVSLSVAISPAVNPLGGGVIDSFPTHPLLPAGLLMLAGLGVCSPTRRDRRNWAALALLTAFTLAAAACGGGGDGEAPPATSPPRGTYTAINLKTATTYNWKVISTDSHGATSESATWQFTTR